MKTKKRPVSVPEPEPVGPPKRCKLCPDGGSGRQLVKVVNAVRGTEYACRTHANFYTKFRTNANRKWLPGNADLLEKHTPPPEPMPPVDAAAIRESVKEADEYSGSRIKLKDKK